MKRVIAWLVFLIIASGIYFWKFRERQFLNTFNQGAEYLNVEDFGSALPYLIDAHKMRPKNINVLNSLAYCYERNDLFEKAIETDRKLLVLNPNHSEAIQRLAENEMLFLGRWEGQKRN